MQDVSFDMSAILFQFHVSTHVFSGDMLKWVIAQG